MFSSIAVLSALFVTLSAPIVNALGSIEIGNACSFNIYEYVVYAGGPTNDGVTPAGQGHYYPFPSANRGVSFKFGPTDAIARGPSDPGGPNGPFQAEITYNATQGLVYYDFSTLDGNPFTNYKRAILPSISGCQKITCPPGKTAPACYPGSYYAGEPSNYNPVYACSANAVLTIEFCGGFKSRRWSHPEPEEKEE